MKLAVCVLAAVLSMTAPLSAQYARGRVTERDSGQPLNGAFVVLLDSLGRQRTAALSDAQGGFLMRAPAAGHYRLRAELIGHESVTSAAFEVPATGAATAMLHMPVAAIEIEGIEAAGDRRCVARPENGRQTAQLWEEARKALAVTSWAATQPGVAEYRTRTYDRELMQGSLAMVWQGVRTGFSQTRPYAAISPDSLAAHGFVRRINADSTLFYGPDAEVLVSDAFLDTHCFHTRRGQGESAGLIGLTFSPVRDRKLPDIAGTLWVDPSSSELKYVEFTYTGWDSPLNVKGVGGRTDFRRLPNGAWIVDRWYIRLPIARRDMRGNMTAAALLEGGGEIVDLKIGGTSIPKANISGMVWDSSTARPLANAYVYLSGTAYSAVTDSAGRFRINDVAGGDYVVAFSHPAFDSLPALPQPRRLTLQPPHDSDVTLGLPMSGTLIARACGGGPGAVIFGTISPDERVTARFTHERRTIERSALGDRNGRYMLCDLPIATTVTLTFPGAEARMVRIPRSGYLRVDEVTP